MGVFDNIVAKCKLRVVTVSVIHHNVLYSSGFGNDVAILVRKPKVILLIQVFEINIYTFFIIT